MSRSEKHVIRRKYGENTFHFGIFKDFNAAKKYLNSIFYIYIVYICMRIVIVY